MDLKAHLHSLFDIHLPPIPSCVDTYFHRLALLVCCDPNNENTSALQSNSMGKRIISS